MVVFVIEYRGLFICIAHHCGGTKHTPAPHRQGDPVVRNHPLVLCTLGTFPLPLYYYKKINKAISGTVLLLPLSINGRLFLPFPKRPCMVLCSPTPGPSPVPGI